MIDFGPAAFIAAFAAGFVTFLSPCVFPLVPGYLGFITGLTSEKEMTEQRSTVIRATSTFIGGFALMFIALGAGAALFGDVLLRNRRPMEILAGVFLVAAGLLFVGVRLPASVMRERRFHLGNRFGAFTPAVAGMAFAVGWTPCVGPTLAGILALAAANGEPAQGAILLGVFSLGLGVPFLGFGLAFTRAVGAAARLRKHARRLNQAAGIVLITFGVLLATGQLTRLTARLARFGIEI